MPKTEVRTDHFEDAPENTFRAIGVMTPDEVAELEQKNQERFDDLLAKQNESPEPKSKKGKKAR
jgi:hypothetical protein